MPAPCRFDARSFERPAPPTSLEHRHLRTASQRGRRTPSRPWRQNHRACLRSGRASGALCTAPPGPQPARTARPRPSALAAPVAIACRTADPATAPACGPTAPKRRRATALAVIAPVRAVRAASSQPVRPRRVRIAAVARGHPLAGRRHHSPAAARRETPDLRDFFASPSEHRPAADADGRPGRPARVR